MSPDIQYVARDDLTTTSQVEAVTVELLEHKTFITSIYNPSSRFIKSTLTFLQSLINTAKRERKKIIVLGDLNAHNAAWNSTKNTTAGTKLLNLIIKSNLHIYNSGQPTYIIKNKNEVLDLCFGSYVDLSANVLSYGISNHALLYINWQLRRQHQYNQAHCQIHPHYNPNNLPNSPFVTNLSESEWKNFSSQTEQQIDNVDFHTNNIEQTVTQLTSIIQQVLSDITATRSQKKGTQT